MTRSKVDLPHPEGPISAMNSPSSIVRSIPFKISVEFENLADGFQFYLCHFAGVPTAMQQRADD